jgi:hypothetical protein
MHICARHNLLIFLLSCSVSNSLVSLNSKYSTTIKIMASVLNSQVTISNWAAIPQAPADKILGLNEEFVKCTDAGKISLGIGAYRDDENLWS